MALASWDTEGEPSVLMHFLWSVWTDLSSCLWTPTAPQMPSAALLSLPSSVSVDIPGTVPEWVCWHLPNVYLTYREYDGNVLAPFQAPGSGWG